MEIQLQELIDQIKKDGVAVAETEANNIVDSAKAEAEKIIADAKAQAEKILADAKIENERMVKSSDDAIRQAGRNLLISFREENAVFSKTSTSLLFKITSMFSTSGLFAQLSTTFTTSCDNESAE